MEQHSERLGPESDQEPRIQAPGDVGDAGGAGAWDAEDADVVAWDGQETADAEDADVVAWDGQEDVDAVGWEPGEDADAGGNAGAVWETQEDAGAAAWDAGDGLDPDGPAERPATGEPRVDAALGRLDELAGRPVTEHRAIFEDVHRRLRDVLGELDNCEQSSGDQAPAAGAERRAGR
jgi:hypothetical protein